MHMSDSILVALIGYNPASAVVAARSRDLDVDRAVLLCTDKTQDRADVVKVQLGVPARCSAWQGVPSIDAVAAAIAERVEIARGDVVVLDLTGATKSMAVGAYMGLRNQVGLALTTVCLQPGGRLEDAATGNALDSRVVLLPEEVLAWNGRTNPTMTWQGGPTDALSAEIEGRRGVCAHLFGKPPKGNTDTMAAMPNAAPPADFQVQRSDWLAPAGFLTHNQWLEEHTLHVARSVLDKHPESRLALSVELRGRVSDESDVVITRGATVTIIEAKNRAPKGAGTDLQKRVRKARRDYGSHAQVIFVNPQWSAKPETTLDEGPGVWLVGRNNEALRTAIKEATGLGRF